MCAKNNDYGLELIDYEVAFQKHIKTIIAKKEDCDIIEIDDQVENIYDEWMDTKSVVFGRKTPSQYFDIIDDPVKLMEILAGYACSAINMPGPLFNRIVQFPDKVYPMLLVVIQTNYATRDRSLTKYVLYCIEIIREINQPYPIDEYIHMIAKSIVGTDIIEAMVELVRADIENQETLTAVKQAYLGAQHEYAKDCLLDIMSDVGCDEEVYEYVLDSFLGNISKSGLYAHMLAKISMLDCETYLIDMLKNPSLNYYNYVQVKEALEELGTYIEIERNFEGDEDFERLSIIDDNEIEDDSDFRSMVISKEEDDEDKYE